MKKGAECRQTAKLMMEEAIWRAQRRRRPAGLVYEVNRSCGDFWLRSGREREREGEEKRESVEPRLDTAATAPGGEKN